MLLAGRPPPIGTQPLYQTRIWEGGVTWRQGSHTVTYSNAHYVHLSVCPYATPLRYFKVFMSMGWDYVSELRSPTGLLFILQVIHEHGKPWQNDNGGRNRRTRRKTCPSATLSTINPTWTDTGANTGLRDEMPVTNHLNCGSTTL